MIIQAVTNKTKVYFAMNINKEEVGGVLNEKDEGKCELKKIYAQISDPIRVGRSLNGYIIRIVLYLQKHKHDIE